jgi:ABC-type transporter Mla subunit MlaD
MVRPGTIAVHVEAAKRLLRELEQHAETALNALGQENGAEFFAAVDERDRILSQLDEVVEALTQERAATVEVLGQADPETMTLMTEMAQAAAAALESHEHLAAQTRRERDRLAAALHLTSKPDSVAHHYAMGNSPLARTLSVTG